MNNKTPNLSKTAIAVDKEHLPDIQNTPDTRGTSLDRVGISNMKFPIRILRKGGSSVDVSADVKLFAGLPKHAKGHNLSRFPEAMVEFGASSVLSIDSMPRFLKDVAERVGSDDVYARFEFDYFINKSAPATGKTGPMPYRCAFTGILRGDDFEFITEVNITAASVCPCSREMSLLENLGNGELFANLESGHVRLNDPAVSDDYYKTVSKIHTDVQQTEIGQQVGMGAHNQRSKIRVESICNSRTIYWLEDLIELVEAQASAPTYPILKRPDEKMVTEMGYMNAKFSEDIARDVHLALTKDEAVLEWSIHIRNEESIHPYDVSSYIKSKGWKFN